MKTIITFFLLLVFSSAYSQELTGIQVQNIPSIHSKTTPINKHTSYPNSPLEQVTLQYFDESLPVIEWVGEGQYGPYILYWVGERMTLPSETGYLDSVSIQIDSLPNDSLFVSIIQDTLYDIGNGQEFRLINIFRTGTVLAVENIYPEEISQAHPVTVRFPHVQVPKEFFVVVSSAINANGQPTNYFFIRGDSKPPRERTAEGSRSAGVFIDLQTGNPISAILDGTFIPNGQTEAAFTDFYITAYADVSGTGVIEPEHNPTKISVFPNPSANTITVTSARSHSTIHIYDALGRTVTTTHSNDTSTKIDVSSIPNGLYTIIVASDNSFYRTSLSIVK